MGHCCYDNECFDFVEAFLEVYLVGHCCYDSDCFNLIEAALEVYPV